MAKIDSIRVEAGIKAVGAYEADVKAANIKRTNDPTFAIRLAAVKSENVVLNNAVEAVSAPTFNLNLTQQWLILRG